MINACRVVLINIVCHYQTVAPLSHSVSLFPACRPPPFLHVFAFTIIHRSGSVYSCMRTQLEGKKRERPGNEASHTQYTRFVIVLCCFSILSISPICEPILVLLIIQVIICVVINWVHYNMIGGSIWIGSSYEVVFLSAVILLHQVCDAWKYQKWTAQSQSDTVEPLYNGHHWGPTFCPL